MKTLLTLLAAGELRSGQTDPHPRDDSFIKELESSGFIAAAYKTAR